VSPSTYKTPPDEIVTLETFPVGSLETLNVAPLPVVLVEETPEYVLPPSPEIFEDDEIVIASISPSAFFTVLPT
jgi:hypothetical protein